MCKTEYAKGGAKLHHPAQDRVKGRGGRGVTFSCLTHMKVFFIAEQPLFMEQSYLSGCVKKLLIFEDQPPDNFPMEIHM